MVAMHGREDPLLDSARFPRLLRQANDAEVADVRKVGDDEYEITSLRAPARPAQPAPTAQREEPSPVVATDGAAVEAGAPPEGATAGSRENGQRFGVRFRRGSRSPLRPGEIPLIGVVQIDTAPEPEPQLEIPAEPVRQEKRPRTRRPARKRAAVDTAGSDTRPADTVDSPPAKRPRPRSRKKAE
jgi:hypothetical protein